MTVSALPSVRTLRRLDAGEVHGDGGDVASEAHARAVGGHVDLLGGVGAVEVHDVLAALALDGVAAVARIPLEVVRAGPEQGDVVAAVAVDEVVAGAADQRVVAVAAAHGVVAGPAVDAQVGERADAVLAVDGVGAGEAADDEVLDGAVVDHAGPGRERGDGGAVARDADGVGGVGAVV